MEVIGRQKFIIIWAALIIHVIQAISMMITPSANTPIDVDSILEWIPPNYAPAVMIITSGLAFISLLDAGFSWYVRLLLLLPQQALITIAVTGVMAAVIRGAYADGTPQAGIHIFNDQIWLVAYFFIHAYSVAKRATT
jgi:hypothetical protein